MGAGAVKGESYASSEPTTSNTNRNPKDIMSCEQCSVNFTLFKRKKICMICRRHHCSNCLPKEPNKPSSQRRCTKCRELSGNPSRADLRKFRVKDLKLYLTGRSVAMDHCTEKNDLVELVLKHNDSTEYFREQTEARRRADAMRSNLRENLSPEPPPTSENETPTSQRQNSTTSSEHSNDATSQRRNDATSQPPNDATASDRPTQTNTEGANQNNFAGFSEDRAQQLRERQQREMREAQERLRAEWADDEPDPRPARKFTALKDVKDESSIEDLTIKQLKEILTANFVDYKGCCEKRELIERVRRLWQDSQKNQQKDEATDESGGADSENELCKICMDAIIDCVLLECGHMVTCTSCGRRLHECPICRNFVVRVVHTFKA